MNNISYSSRYKFLISLGVLLVASPFLFILGYMKSIGELLELKDFPKGYEKDVIDLISFKKDFLFTIKHNPRLFTLIAILIIGFGLYLIKIGLDRWEEFDNVDLEKLKNENDKLENENKKLIIEIGGLENVNSTLAHLSTVSISEAIDNKNLKMLTSENVENYSKDIIYGEKFINQLRLECADDYLIYNNFKLDNEYILDAVAISKLKAEKDIIYEIKYLNNLDKSLIESKIVDLLESANIYKNLTNKETKQVLALITSNHDYDNYNEMINSLENYQVEIKLIRETDIE